MAVAEKLANYHGLKVTREEYLDLDEDGNKYDMVDGVLIMAPSAEFEHGKQQGRMFHFLTSFLEKYPKAEMAVEIDIFLPDRGDVLRPDISLILSENVNIIKKHIHGTPDLIVEVLSDGTRARDLGNKADRYLKCGVKEYWIIDPKEKAIAAWINRGSQWEKRQGPNVVSELLPGFSVATNQLFSSFRAE
jgi:Uma2 family endonuclease